MDSQGLSQYQMGDKVQFGGCFTKEKCVEIGKKIMTIYDGNNDGYLESLEIGFMISDAYRAMNRSYNPSPNVVQNAMKIVDVKRTGKVHVEDILQLAYKYFHGTPPAEPVKKIPQKLSRVAAERLEVARRIFKKVDKDQSNYLTENEVPELLRETYLQMGMTYEPTQEDVVIWIEMTDSDGDGKVTLEDYEQLVLRSLQQQGISLE